MVGIRACEAQAVGVLRMPEVSRFYGIVITLNYNDHAPLHFHARYGGDAAVITINGIVWRGPCHLGRLHWFVCGQRATRTSCSTIGSERAHSSRWSRSIPSTSMAAMIEIAAVEPLDGRAVRLTLSSGEVIVRDLGDLLHGPLFEPIADDESLFRQVRVGLRDARVARCDRHRPRDPHLGWTCPAQQVTTGTRHASSSPGSPPDPPSLDRSSLS